MLQRHYNGFRDKVERGELEDKIAAGGMMCDKDPNAVF
jgi:hypothetical protein